MGVVVYQAAKMAARETEDRTQCSLAISEMFDKLIHQMQAMFEKENEAYSKKADRFVAHDLPVSDSAYFE